MKKVLVVGMFDSVHLARWLSQFDNQNLEITVFPSSRFRRIHPDLESMIQKGEINLYSSVTKKVLPIAGYFDFIRFELLANKVKALSRSKALRKYVGKSNIDILHLIELQHAGYLYLETEIRDGRSFKVISTNYGSDLVYFISNPTHKEKLAKLLQQSDFYSAECRRDYDLAKELGFMGIELPLMPNAGGFSDEILNQRISPLRERKIVYVKGYGGKFGLGNISLKVADRLLYKFSDIEVVVVSLTDDLRKVADEIQKRHKNRIKIYGTRDGIDHEQVLGILRSSIICIGASQSDGISTTFLEALVSGTVAIQTNTSCANEWTEKGFFAKVVPPFEEDIFNAARQVLENTENYESAILDNIVLSKSSLSFVTLSSIAHGFYGVEAGKSQ